MAGDWAQVGRELRRRMAECRVNEYELAALARMSPNTVKSILNEAKDNPPRKDHAPSSLYALATELGWPSKYLINILDGASPDALAAEAEERSVLEAAWQVSLLDNPARSAELRDAVADMARGAGTVLRIAREITGDETPAS